MLQRALDALLTDWMGLLSGCLRVWEADQLTSLLRSPGEDVPPHTSLVTMFEAGDYRSLVTATQQTLSEAFAFTEDFRQVKNCHAHAESQHSGGMQLVQTAGFLTSLANLISPHLNLQPVPHALTHEANML